jgi:hypothetical protein
MTTVKGFIVIDRVCDGASYVGIVFSKGLKLSTSIKVKIASRQLSFAFYTALRLFGSEKFSVLLWRVDDSGINQKSPEGPSSILSV